MPAVLNVCVNTAWFATINPSTSHSNFDIATSSGSYEFVPSNAIDSPSFISIYPVIDGSLESIAIGLRLTCGGTSTTFIKMNDSKLSRPILS